MINSNRNYIIEIKLNIPNANYGLEFIQYFINEILSKDIIKDFREAEIGIRNGKVILSWLCYWEQFCSEEIGEVNFYLKDSGVIFELKLNYLELPWIDTRELILRLLKDFLKKSKQFLLLNSPRSLVL